EVFVALNHSRPAQTFEIAAPIGLTIGDQFFGVGERNCGAEMNQIRDQESRPGTAGSGIGNKKGVIGPDREAAPRNVRTQYILYNFLESIEHGRVTVYTASSEDRSVLGRSKTILSPCRGPIPTIPARLVRPKAW